MNPSWDGVQGVFFGQWADKSIFDSQSLSIRYVVATHFYGSQKDKLGKVLNSIVHAMCWRLPLSYLVVPVRNDSDDISSRTLSIAAEGEHCKKLKQQFFDHRMYVLDGYDFVFEVERSFDENVLERVQSERLRRIQNCTHRYLFW